MADVPTRRYHRLKSVRFITQDGTEHVLSGVKGIQHRITPDGRALAALTILDVAQATSFAVDTVGRVVGTLRDMYLGSKHTVEVEFGAYCVFAPPVIDAGFRQIAAASIQLEAIGRGKTVAGVPADEQSS